MAELPIALLAATVMAVFGFLKRAPEEAFEPKKIISTYVAAFFVALLFTVWEVPVELGEELFVMFLVKSGIMVYVERLIKAIWRRLNLDEYLPGDTA